MNGDHLRQAGALMKAHGMTRHTRHDLFGRMCALGAVERAMFGITSMDPASDRTTADLSTEVRVLADVLTELYPHREAPFSRPASVVATVNNHPDTTIEDLLVAFEKAATRMDEVGEFT